MGRAGAMGRWVDETREQRRAGGSWLETASLQAAAPPVPNESMLLLGNLASIFIFFNNFFFFLSYGPRCVLFFFKRICFAAFQVGSNVLLQISVN